MNEARWGKPGVDEVPDIELFDIQGCRGGIVTERLKTGAGHFQRLVSGCRRYRLLSFGRIGLRRIGLRHVRFSPRILKWSVVVRRGRIRHGRWVMAHDTSGKRPWRGGAAFPGEMDDCADFAAPPPAEVSLAAPSCFVIRFDSLWPLCAQTRLSALLLWLVGHLSLSGGRVVWRRRGRRQSAGIMPT